MYLAIQIIDSLMFFELEERCSKEPWREIEWNDLFQHSGSINWFGLYRIWMLMTSSDWLMLAVFKTITLPHIVGMFFRARALFWTYCCVLIEPMSVILLTELPELLLSLYNSWELSIWSTMSLLGRSFLISILLWYGVEEAFERIKVLLELTLLGKLVLFLIKSLLTFIAILADINAI